MREIVLDTETTGLNPQGGDRVVEIGCVELVNHILTGESYHVYVNPERDMPDEAFQVHGEIGRPGVIDMVAPDHRPRGIPRRIGVRCLQRAW